LSNFTNCPHVLQTSPTPPTEEVPVMLQSVLQLEQINASLFEGPEGATSRASLIFVCLSIYCCVLQAEKAKRKKKQFSSSGLKKQRKEEERREIKKGDHKMEEKQEFIFQQ
jgi:hypothetical protein